MLDFDHYGDSHARWPGSILLGVLKSGAKNTIEEYKQKLPKRKNPSPVSESPSQFRLLVNRFHGHVTLVVLVGTLVNVLSKLYMGTRYEDLQRLSFEKYQWRVSAEHWQRRGEHSEVAYKFWSEFVRKASKQKEDRIAWIQECQKWEERLSARSKPPLSNAPWPMTILRVFFSFYYSAQDRQRRFKLQRVQETCKFYKEWARHWEDMHTSGQTEVGKYKTTRKIENATAISHGVAALHWQHRPSRDLVTRFRIPWTGIVITLWRARWSDLD
ncbi:hypothetical protein BSKO_03223 [Bryopsis sp. KO-2023]|nr:hypothetical protein BSKO_03223 [Bryopsis sp. KO-2023]